MFSSGFINEVTEFKAFVERFDYSQLRSEKITIPGETEAQYVASERVIKDLIAFFSKKLLCSEDEDTRSAFKALNSRVRLALLSKKDVTTEMIELIRDLAATLLKFKNGISAMEKICQGRQECEYKVSPLRKDSSWVLCFHYMIEQPLTDGPYRKTFSLNDYRRFIHNVQGLGEGVYCWLKKYDPEQAPLYKVFASTSELEREMEKERYKGTSPLFGNRKAPISPLVARLRHLALDPDTGETLTAPPSLQTQRSPRK